MPELVNENRSESRSATPRRTQKARETPTGVTAGGPHLPLAQLPRLYNAPGALSLKTGVQTASSWEVVHHCSPTSCEEE